MQTVTAGWNTNQALNVTSNGYIELVYNVVDDDLAAPTVTDNGHLDMSNVSNTYANTVTATKYATMERNLAICDGTFDIVPATAPYGYNCYVSDVMSDASGEFTTDPLITITFPAVTSTVLQKITIDWSNTYGEYPTAFTLTSKNGAAVVDTEVVTGNTSLQTETTLTMTSFDIITIEVNEWNTPYHRARLEKILIGSVETYTQAELKGFSMERRCGLFSETLPVLKIKFDLDNSQGQFDPYNPAGESAYILLNQPVTARLGFDIGGTPEMIAGGTYYMSGWDNLTNTDKVSFEADGITALMTGVYEKGVYGSISLYDLAEDVLEDADMPLNSDDSNPWDLDSSLSSIYTTAPLGLHTHAECLQLIANAGECIFYIDLDGQIIIKPRVEAVQDYEIKPFNEYSQPDLEYIQPVSILKTRVHEYSEDDVDSTTVKKSVTPGTYSITWDEAITDAFVDFIGEVADYSTEKIFSHQVVALSSSLAVVAYTIYNTDGLAKSYVISGSIYGTAVTFSEAVEIATTEYTDELAFTALCKIDSSRFAVSYLLTESGTGSNHAKIGSVEDGVITLGSAVAYPATATTVTDIKLVGNNLVSAYNNY